MQRHRSRLLLSVVATVIAAALIVVVAISQGTFTPDKRNTTWNSNETVGITSLEGSVDATFTRPEGKQQTSPLSSTLEVIGRPVDIQPKGDTKGLSVVFKVPSRVPLKSTDRNGDLQRSVYNAAIEVYEPSMGVWVPLETKVKGDTLVAQAPHFSIFQAVWLKMGKQEVGEIKITTTPAMTPLDLLWRTGAEYLKQFAFNAIGRFDPAKFNCSNLNEDYGVTLASPNKTDDFDVCVTKKDDASSTILVKNGWAVPLHLTHNAKKGVTPDTRPADIDLVALVRNHLGKAVTGGAYASGLDVGSFTIDHEAAPSQLQIKAEASWIGAAADVAVAMLTAIFPASTLAGKTDALANLGNCLAVGAQKNLTGTPGTDVPAKLMETAKACMVPFIVDELSINSFLGVFAKEARILPELLQMGKIAALKAVTGKDPSATSARVEKTGGFEELQGLWTYECGGSYNLFGVDGREVSWTITEYDQFLKETKTYTKGTLYSMSGKNIMIVDETNMSGLSVGMRADLAVLQGRGAPSVDVMFSQDKRYGYIRRGGPSYC